MSLFSTWSVRARQSLHDAGVRLSLSHSKEILAAGLGHRTYASFKQLDEVRLAHTKVAVLSADAMAARAGAFAIELPLSAFAAVVAGLRVNGDAPSPHPERLETFDGYVRLQLADKLVADGHFRPIVFGRISGPPGLLADAASPWRWVATPHDDGFLFGGGQPEGGYPVAMEFEKLGRHLLGAGRISRVEATFNTDQS